MMTAMGLIDRAFAYLNTLPDVQRNIAIGLILSAVGTLGVAIWWVVQKLWKWFRPDPFLSAAAVAKEWGKLEKRFAKLNTDSIAASHRLQDSLAVVSADKFDDEHNPESKWRISSRDESCRKDAVALCSQAGALLCRSGFEVSQSIRKIKNDKDRWLSFLLSLGEGHESELRMQVSTFEDGTPIDDMFMDEIDNVAQASTRACITCKAKLIAEAE